MNTTTNNDNAALDVGQTETAEAMSLRMNSPHGLAEFDRMTDEEREAQSAAYEAALARNASAATTAQCMVRPPEVGELIRDVRTGKIIRVEEVWNSGHCWGLVVKGEGHKEGPHFSKCVSEKEDSISDNGTS